MQKRSIAIGVAALAGAMTLAACGSNGKGSDSSATTSAAADNKPAASSVSWPAPADASAQVKAAGLPMLGQEGQVLHIHSHLDVFVDGKTVTVPAEVGIDEAKQQISPLHTHDTSGVVHIESPVKADFTLGEFMTEWNVPVSKDALGPLKTGGGMELHVFVNGKEQAGDPAKVKLGAHEEIAVVYGPAADKVKVPASYNWPEGL
jgi:predicted small secreted protein